MNYHAAYEPQRVVRADRYKYIRRYDNRISPVLSNIDNSLSKDDYLDHGFVDRVPVNEQLYDTYFDPAENDNLVSQSAYAPILREMRSRLESWMRETDDPLLRGPIYPPPGAFIRDPEGMPTC